METDCTASEEELEVTPDTRGSEIEDIDNEGVGVGRTTDKEAEAAGLDNAFIGNTLVEEEDDEKDEEVEKGENENEEEA